MPLPAIPGTTTREVGTGARTRDLIASKFLTLAFAYTVNGDLSVQNT